VNSRSLKYFSGNQDEVKNSGVTPIWIQYRYTNLKMILKQQQRWHIGW